MDDRLGRLKLLLGVDLIQFFDLGYLCLPRGKKMTKANSEIEEWNAKCSSVVDQMNRYVRDYVTPLSLEKDDNVRLIGTGSFIKMNTVPSIITCHHVVLEADGNLDYLMAGNNGIYKYCWRWSCIADPVDVACTKDTLAPLVVEQKTIRPDQIATNHELSQPEELLYFYGFSGENSNYGFGHLVSNPTGYLTQQSKEAVQGDDTIQLLMPAGEPHWSAETSEEAAKTMRFGDPRGFSGSLVWNTRFLETGARLDSWSPKSARVTGILKRFDERQRLLLATPIEKLSHFKAL